MNYAFDHSWLPIRDVGNRKITCEITTLVVLKVEDYWRLSQIRDTIQIDLYISICIYLNNIMENMHT